MTDRYRAGKRLWSASDDELMRQAFPYEPTAVIAKRLRRSFSAVSARAGKLGIHKSAAYLASPSACRLRRGDHVGAAFRFKKGQAPPNKGLRRPGWGPGRMKETQFKKGERRGVAVKLWKPIGSERISKDGYLERKVTDSIPDGLLMLRNTVHNLPKPLASIPDIAVMGAGLEAVADLLDDLEELARDAEAGTIPTGEAWSSWAADVARRAMSALAPPVHTAAAGIVPPSEQGEAP